MEQFSLFHIVHHQLLSPIQQQVCLFPEFSFHVPILNISSLLRFMMLSHFNFSESLAFLIPCISVQAILLCSFFVTCPCFQFLDTFQFFVQQSGPSGEILGLPDHKNSLLINSLSPSQAPFYFTAISQGTLPSNSLSKLKAALWNKSRV